MSFLIDHKLIFSKVVDKYRYLLYNFYMCKQMICRLHLFI